MNNNIIWIDENENELGEVSYEKAHQEGLMHRVSVVYLNNDKNEILIQKRMSGRLDHSSAGHVDVGESYIDAAKRELKEELGVSGVDLIEVGDCRADESYENMSIIKHKFKVYQCLANPGQLDPEEVKEVFWADPKEVWQKMKNDTDNRIYCAGFKATLELYLKTKK